VGAGTNFPVDMPTGVTLETNDLEINGKSHYGTGTWFDSGVGFKSLHVRRPNSTSISFWEIGANNVWDGTQAANGDTLSFEASLKVLGWGGEGRMSEDAGNREISFLARGLSDSSLSADTAKTIIANSVKHNNGQGYNSTTGVFTAPESGEYLFIGRASATLNLATNQRFFGFFAVSSTGSLSAGRSNGVGVSNLHTVGAPVQIKLSKGDTVEFRVQSSIAGTLQTSEFEIYFSGHKLASPQTIFDSGKTATNDNYVINGNFDFWQRGTSLGSGTGARRIADRFRHDATGSTYTVSRQTITQPSSELFNANYFLRKVVTSSAGDRKSVV
jgi:hypothetical protein